MLQFLMKDDMSAAVAGESGGAWIAGGVEMILRRVGVMGKNDELASPSGSSNAAVSGSSDIFSVSAIHSS